jgi:hypothetical protein
MNPPLCFRAARWVVFLFIFTALRRDAAAQSAPRVSFFGTTGQVVEEDVGMLRIPVFRNTNVSLETRVSFTTRGVTASPGINYVETFGELVFPVGESLQYIDIPILDDAIHAEAGTFDVVLSVGPEVVIQNGNSRTITIQDDDGPGEFEFRWSYSSAYEGSPYAEIEVIRAKGRAGRVEVAFSTEDGSAIAGEDYVETSGVLVFETGVMQQKVRIPILNDDLFEGFPNLKIHLTSATNGGTLGTKTTHFISLWDSSREPTFGFAAAKSLVREGAKYATIPVARTGGMTDSSWTIYYVVKSGTAKEGADFKSTSGVLDFGPSTTEAKIYVPLIDDGETERDETFTVELTSGASYYSLKTHTVTIMDDDVIYPSGTATYTGLVEEDVDWYRIAHGTITITIDEARAFSGVFRFRGSSYPFRGKVEPAGMQARINMKTPQVPSAILTIDANFDSARLEGKLSWSPLPPLKFVADRVKTGTKAAPVPECGRYTMMSGTATAVEVSPTGKAWVRFLDVANGHLVTKSGMVDRNGRIAIVMATPRSRFGGSARGSFGIVYEVAPDGPWDMLSTTYFGYNEQQDYGYTYAPVKDGRALGDFDFTNGACEIQNQPKRSASWSANGQVVRCTTPSERWKLKVDAKTGLCRGSLSAYGVSYPVWGICIQQPGRLDDFIALSVRFSWTYGTFGIVPVLK